MILCLQKLRDSEPKFCRGSRSTFSFCCSCFRFRRSAPNSNRNWKKKMFREEWRVWKFQRNAFISFFFNLTNDKFCLNDSSLCQTSGHQINCHRHIVRDIYSLTSSFLILWEQFCEHSKNMLSSRHIHRVLFFDEHQLDHGDEPYTYTNLTYTFFWSKCSWWICTGL